MENNTVIADHPTALSDEKDWLSIPREELPSFSEGMSAREAPSPPPAVEEEHVVAKAPVPPVPVVPTVPAQQNGQAPGEEHTRTPYFREEGWKFPEKDRKARISAALKASSFMTGDRVQEFPGQTFQEQWDAYLSKSEGEWWGIAASMEKRPVINEIPAEWPWHEKLASQEDMLANSSYGSHLHSHPDPSDVGFNPLMLDVGNPQNEGTGYTEEEEYYLAAAMRLSLHDPNEAKKRLAFSYEEGTAYLSRHKPVAGELWRLMQNRTRFQLNPKESTITGSATDFYPWKVNTEKSGEVLASVAFDAVQAESKKAIVRCTDYLKLKLEYFASYKHNDISRCKEISHEVQKICSRENLGRMIVGPPGSGKTEFARQLASHYGLPLVMVNPAEGEDISGDQLIVKQELNSLLDPEGAVSGRMHEAAYAYHFGGLLLIDELLTVQGMAFLAVLLDPSKTYLSLDGYTSDKSMHGKVIIRHPGFVPIFTGNRGKDMEITAIGGRAEGIDDNLWSRLTPVVGAKGDGSLDLFEHMFPLTEKKKGEAYQMRKKGQPTVLGQSPEGQLIVGVVANFARRLNNQENTAFPISIRDLNQMFSISNVQEAFRQRIPWSQRIDDEAKDEMVEMMLDAISQTAMQYNNENKAKGTQIDPRPQAIWSKARLLVAEDPDRMRTGEFEGCNVLKTPPRI